MLVYRAELQRGAAMFGFPGADSKTPQEFDQQIVKSAEDPLFAIPKTQAQDPKEVKVMVQAASTVRAGQKHLND